MRAKGLPLPRRKMSSDSLLESDQIHILVPQQPKVVDPGPYEGVELELVPLKHGTDRMTSLEENDSPSNIESRPPMMGSKATGLANWLLEMIYLIVAMACLAAIFAILVRFGGDEQPELPFASLLNLSALVALIATILRPMLEGVITSGTVYIILSMECCLIYVISVIGQLKWDWFRSSTRSLGDIATFDDASRGIWGSVVFLVSLLRPYVLRSLAQSQLNPEADLSYRNLATLGALMTVLAAVIGTFSQQALQTVLCQKRSSEGQASIPIAQTLAGLRGLQPFGNEIENFTLDTDLKVALIAGLASSR